jgi:lysophospholipase L1-like esterase
MEYAAAGRARRRGPRSISQGVHPNGHPRSSARRPIGSDRARAALWAALAPAAQAKLFPVSRDVGVYRTPDLKSGLGVIKAGKPVNVQCWVNGQSVGGYAVWDQIAFPAVPGGIAYVHDKFVQMPRKTHPRDNGIPSCPGGGAKPPAAQLPRYVAMGDSYSSGEGADSFLPPGPGLPGRCHRSQNAYSQLLAERLGDRYRHDPATDFLACSGDEVPDLLSRQLPKLGPDVGLITVGIGGNDSGWTKVLKSCAIQGAIPPPAAVFRKSCKRIAQESFDSRLPELRKRLQTAYAQIKAKAPGAKVIVVGYPAIFEDSFASIACASAGDLGRRARSDLREAAGRLDDLIKQLALQAGFRFVDPRPAFDDHRICGPKQDWIHGVTRRDGKVIETALQTFHPNQAGQAGYANAIAAANRDIFP